MSIVRLFLLVCCVVAAARAGDSGALERAWSHLDSPDRSIREAARLAIEAQPFATWRQRALGETRTRAALEALLALVRACPRAQGEELRPHVCEGISTLHLEGMNAEQQLAAVRLTRLAGTRLGPLSADERRQMTDLWTHFLPPKNVVARDSPVLGREIRELLEFLAASDRPKP